MVGVRLMNGCDAAGAAGDVEPLHVGIVEQIIGVAAAVHSSDERGGISTANEEPAISFIHRHR